MACNLISRLCANRSAALAAAGTVLLVAGLSSLEARLNQQYDDELNRSLDRILESGQQVLNRWHLQVSEEIPQQTSQSGVVDTHRTARSEARQKKLDSLLSGIHSSSGAELYAFDRNGALLVSGGNDPSTLPSSPRLAESDHPDATDSHPYYRARQQNQLSGTPLAKTYTSYRGVPVVGRWRWNPTAEIGLGAELHVDDAFRQRDQSILALRLMAALGGLILIFSFVLRARGKSITTAPGANWRAGFEQASAGIAHLDLNGDWIALNRRFCQLLNSSEQQLRLSPFPLAEGDPDDRPSERRSSKLQQLLVDLAAAPDRTLVLEKPLRRSDGIDIQASVAITLIQDSAGAPDYLLLVLENVGNRNQTLEELIRSQQCMAEAEHIAGIGYWFVELPDLRLGWSDQTNRIFELDQHCGEPTLSLLLEKIHPQDSERVEREINSAIAGANTESIDFRVPLKDGGERLVNTRFRTTRDSNGNPLTLIGTVQDISDQAQADARLRQAAQVFESASEGIVIASTEPAIIAVNPAFTRITGYCEQEVIGRNPSILSSGKQGGEFYRELWTTLSATGRWQGELWNRRKNGELYPEWMTISAVQDPLGKASHYVAMFSDISKLKESEDKLAFLAHHDPLTHLPNRIMLDRYLRHSLQKSEQSGIPLAVLFLDLDDFKYINDTWGHPCGDRILQLVSRRLLHSTGDNAQLTRHGGDEFVLVVEEAGRPELELLVNSLLKTLEAPFSADGREYHLSGSIGISLFPDDGDDVDTLIKNADAAMFEAKKLGRNRYCYYQQELTDQTRSDFELLADLRRALELEELEVYYQPQISFSSGKISGVEALLRWNHTRKGMIGPDKFIPLAEKSGLIIPIGNWVLEQSCLQLKRWQQSGAIRFPISVNLSVVQFRAPDLVETVGRILDRCQLATEYLELELTESTLIDSPEDALTQLNRLTEMGISIALDDFGTGYSSLSYLGRYPIDRVKIDREFVRRLITDTDNTLITRSIISMSHHLHCQVVAEGVETQTQLTYLLDQGCDHLQGYLFSKPLPAAELTELLREGRTLTLPTSGHNGDTVRSLLLLDDEPSVLHALRRSLRKEGYRILTAEDPFEALELLATSRIGVVVTDQRMPQMTGTDFLIRVRRLYPETVRIVLSGHADIDAITAAVNEGDVYRYLLKPWDDQALRQHIAEAFEHYESQSQNLLLNDSLMQLIGDYQIDSPPRDNSGIELLDKQHQELIQACQLLGQTVTMTTDPAQIAGITEQMLQLCEENFQLEEELMSLSRYPQLQEHVCEHRMFTSQLRRLQSEQSENNPHQGVLLVLFVGMWIRHHEREADSQLTDFLSRQQAGQLPDSLCKQ